MIDKRIRVALAGVGNCAGSLVHAVTLYRPSQTVAGVTRLDLGGYLVDDIEFSAAFDVSAHKVGRDLAEAILAPPNQASPVPELAVRVWRGPTLDGLASGPADLVPEARERTVDVGRVLRETETQVLVSFLPAGSQLATRFYAEEALRAGCALVNCTPVPVAADPQWRARFELTRLPLIGDDVKSLRLDAAGPVIDAIRCVRLALDRSIGGVLLGPCSALMTSPPEPSSDEAAGRELEHFISTNPSQRTPVSAC